MLANSDLSWIDWDEWNWGYEQGPADMGDLVEAWVRNYRRQPVDRSLDWKDAPDFWAWDAVYRLSYDHPAQALAFIEAMLAHPAFAEIRFGLAAGPIEDMLGEQGPLVIETIERWAAENAMFRDTLRGVWKFTMTDEIWRRVRVARGDFDAT